MNKNDFIKKLENLDLPKIELPSHQRRLKMALLNSGYFKEQFTMTTLLKKVTLPVGALALVAIVAVSVISLTGQPSQASAQEIAKKTYQTISNLPADQQARISGAVGFDSSTALQEAMNAPDLKALSYDEFAGSGPIPPDPDGKLHTLKFLQYTGSQGQIVTLGIDQKSNLPVFGSVKMQNANPPAGVSGEQGFNTMIRDGNGLTNCTIVNGVEKCEKVSE